jgi:hypothetical protein
MNRRDFLKVSSLFSAALFIQVGPLSSKARTQPIELEYKGMLFRGTRDGEIHVSYDSGQTWQLHTRLGTECSITSIFMDWSQRVHTQIAFADRSFDLVLAKGNRYWVTA